MRSVAHLFNTCWSRSRTHIFPTDGQVKAVAQVSTNSTGLLVAWILQDSSCHYLVCLIIHSSSVSSLAELRFSGSHCSILRMKRRKLVLSFPSRDVSLCSSGDDSGISIPGLKSSFDTLSEQYGVFGESGNPLVAEKYLLFKFARASRLDGGGPSSAIISARWVRPRYVLNSGS